jgi:lysozyme
MTIYEQLARDEGCRLKPYLDTVGKTTIGIGRNLTDVGITIEEAHYLLSNDVARADRDVSRLIPWSAGLDGVRQAVLINLCFNVGIGKLLTFKKMLAAMEVGDWTTAASEMLSSKYASDVGDRAKRLAKQLVEGTWQ